MRERIEFKTFFTFLGTISAVINKYTFESQLEIYVSIPSNFIYIKYMYCIYQSTSYTTSQHIISEILLNFKNIIHDAVL